MWFRVYWYCYHLWVERFLVDAVIVYRDSLLLDVFLFLEIGYDLIF